MRLTTKYLKTVFAISLLLALASIALAIEEGSFLARSFPEKIGDFARVSVKKDDAAIRGDVTDAAIAKYAAGASEIEWRGMAFFTSEEAFAALERTMNSYNAEGVKFHSVKNVEGKVRYAVIETKEKIVCCWVNKQRKNLFFIATGQLPEIESFMRAQWTW
ncbi:MAG: hypothetical protein ABJB22_04325 [Verrucomicrobiota bacterium]